MFCKDTTTGRRHLRHGWKFIDITGLWMVARQCRYCGTEQTRSEASHYGGW